ncbi:YciI family protein [Brachybacterium hainanense]|uniref:YciI family protein n=1 Tax=Brachybacterium hainanense TaxID=1541174 RepID=A0ABV6RD06_9MICO
MTQYLLSNITPAGRTLDPERLQHVIAEVTEVTRQMQSAGVWVFAMPLADPSTATVVTAGEQGIALADGPFAELKEYIGGITVIDVPDLDTATEWAGRVAQATGLAIEVRPAPSFGG